MAFFWVSYCTDEGECLGGSVIESSHQDTAMDKVHALGIMPDNCTRSVVMGLKMNSIEDVRASQREQFVGQMDRFVSADEIRDQKHHNAIYDPATNTLEMEN